MTELWCGYSRPKRHLPSDEGGYERETSFQQEPNGQRSGIRRQRLE